MKEFLSNIQRLTINIITIIIIISISGVMGVSKSQSLTATKKKKADFVSQDEKELDKIKNLKVKTRIKYSAGYNPQTQLPTEKKLVAKESFNKKGLLAETIEYDAYGTISSSIKFTYNSKGNPVKADAVETRGGNSTQLSKYDSRGNEIERRLIVKKRRTEESKTVFKYDKDDNIIETFEYSNDKLMNQQNITYKDGKRISSIVKDANGNIALTMTPEYDSNGKIIKEQRKEGNVSIAVTYKYDSKGNVVEMIDNETKRYYAYNDKTNVIEYKIYLLDGRRQLRLTFKYDRNGLQSEIIRYDNNEKPVLYTKFEYEYYK